MRVVKVINAPLERVWEILTDTRQWPVWGPSVSRVACPQRFISPGLQGRLKTAVGIWVTFEITRYEAPVFWDWKVAGVAATGHRLTKLTDNSCELVFELSFAAFPYALICRRAANRIARLALQDLLLPAGETEGDANA
jgi:uncharacterized protein YndB with AHSA1/START domain